VEPIVPFNSMQKNTQEDPHDQYHLIDISCFVTTSASDNKDHSPSPLYPCEIAVIYCIVPFRLAQRYTPRGHVFLNWPIRGHHGLSEGDVLS
jgi:hypothetical protein